jgi:hypothetical protein
VRCKACRWAWFCFPNKDRYGMTQGFYAGEAAKAKPVDAEKGCGFYEKGEGHEDDRG